MPPKFKPNAVEPQAISVPTAMATRPAGMPCRYLTPPNQLSRMMAKQIDADDRRHEHLQGRAMEMKVMETPASVPSSAARGVILRMMGAMNPPAISTKLCTNTQVSPASQPFTGSLVVRAMGSITTNVTMNMCGTLMPEGSAQTSVRPVFLREPIGQKGVIHRAQAHHQAGGGQDAPEDEVVGHFQHKAQQRREREQVDEDVGAEAEEGVPVARHPEFRFWCSWILSLVCVCGWLVEAI